MPHEPRTAGLPSDAAELLGRLWRAVFARGGEHVTREQLRVVARAISAAAHRVALPPEQLVVAVKESWHAYGELRRRDEMSDRHWILTEIVSQCIREYYRPDASASAWSNRPAAASATSTSVGAAPHTGVSS